jgi:hypothetical protein
MNKDITDKLQEWVKINYTSSNCGWTAERSRGNYDDCFEDGEHCGFSCAAYEVGMMLGMKLEEPDEPIYDDE